MVDVIDTELFQLVELAESESELVDIARRTISESAWVVGMCASAWTKRYSRGRTDRDFAELVGFTEDQIYSRRRVVETFSDVFQQYHHLTWSHFYIALTWDDAAECLGWADENQASIAEMKAWRRMQHGEDITAPADDQPDEFPEIPEIVAAEEDGQRDAEPQRTQAAAGPAVTERPAATSRPSRERAADPGLDNGDGAQRDATLIRRACSRLTEILPQLDDAEAGITDLLATLWQTDQESTFRAIRRFAQVNGIK